MFIINFFLLSNLCGFFFFCSPLFFWVFLFVCFFLLYFALFFVNFGGLSLPCHLLCCLLLFVYFFYLFIFLPSWIFWGLFFVSLIALGTSSLRLIVFPLGVWVARGPRFGDWYRGVVCYTNDDLGKRVGWLRRIDEHGTEETVDDGLGGRCLGAGRCPVAPPPWLVMAGRLRRWCQLLSFFLIFWKSMGIAGKVLEWIKKGSLLNCCWVGRWIPQCFPKHYSCYDTDRTAEISDAPTSLGKGGEKSKSTPELLGRGG